MAQYSISYIEQLTGIKAHTLRIWEQRYRLVKAHRTGTNIRYYTDSQLRQVLNISLLLQQGYRIGDIARMGTAGIHKQVLQLQQLQQQENLHQSSVINQLVMAAMTYNEPLFTQIYHEALLQYGLHKMYTQLILPLMTRIGLLWGTGEIIPASEHFLSNLLRQKLIFAIEQVKTRPTGPVWVLFLPEEEEHELGLLYAAFVLKSAGYRVVYLGQRVPATNVNTTVKTVKAQGVLWFVVKHTPASKVQQIISSLQKMHPSLPQIICTSSAQAQDIKSSVRIQVMHHVNNLDAWIKTQKKNRTA